MKAQGRAAKECSDLIWSDLRVAPQPCFNNISYFFPQDRDTAMEFQVLPTQNIKVGGEAEAKAVPSSSFGEDRPAHQWRVNAFFPL